MQSIAGATVPAPAGLQNLVKYIADVLDRDDGMDKNLDVEGEKAT